MKQLRPILFTILIFYVENSVQFFHCRSNSKVSHSLSLLSTVTTSPATTIDTSLRQHFTPNEINDQQWGHLEALADSVVDWNAKINIVSRKDIHNIVDRHIIPSLSLRKLLGAGFEEDVRNVIDVGTGGGFPGLPLAIICPNVKFTLIDARSKKVEVVKSLVNQLGLQNVQVIHGRVEELKSNHNHHYNYVLGRAVTSLSTFISLTKHLIYGNRDMTSSSSSSLENGILYMTSSNNTLDELNKADLLPNHVSIHKVSQLLFHDRNLFEKESVERGYSSVVHIPVKTLRHKINEK